MDLSDISKLDPNKIKFHPDVKIKQEHVDKLFSGIAPLLQKYHKDNPLICDAACQDNKQKDAAYNNYLKAKRNLAQAPEEFKEAEKQFYELAPNGQSYQNFKQKQAETQVKQIVEILSEKFDKKIEEVNSKLKNYQQQGMMTNHMKELKDSYGRDINQMNTEIGRYKNKMNINDRLSYYYSKQIKILRHWLYYIKIIYAMLLTWWFCYFIMYKNFWLQKKLAILTTILVLVPLVIRKAVGWFYPIKIFVPPPDPICPTKPPSKVIAPPKSIIPEKKKKPRWVAPPPPAKPTCPQPTIWSAITNSMPQIGHGDAASNLENRFKNWGYRIEDTARSVTNKVSNLI